MDLIHYSIQKPVTVSVGVLLLLLFGLISLSQIPIQLTPTLETTVVSVTTTWEGASPQEVEREIVREQEEMLKGIQSLQRMISSSEQGEGRITLEFALGTTKEAALRETSDKLREVRQYPDNADQPVVAARNPADRDYIAWVVVTCTDPAYDVRQLYDFFDDRVRPELERVEGIGEIFILGGWEKEAHIKVDPHKLAQRSISPTQLAGALRTQNSNASAGQLVEGRLDVRVRSIGRFEHLHEIEQTMLSRPGEPVVRVKDVAAVSIGYKDPNRIVRNKGRVVLAINAQREVGSNVIEVMEGFRATLRDVRDNALPIEAARRGIKGEIQMEQVYDQTVYIHQAVDLVLSNLWMGGILATGVLLLFLRSVRSTLVIALAIPTSVIGTFLAMAAMGRSINVISLAGLAFAVGMVVDNAIVVLENIDRHRKLGQPIVSAVYRATREVWGALLASTLTTVAVFLPILFVREEAGQLFRDIALAIIASVSLSLLVAVTVIPCAASRWLSRAAPPTDRKEQEHASIFSAPGLLFSRFLMRLMQTRALRLGVIAAMAVVSIVGSFWLMPPSSYLPGGNRNMVFGRLSGPPGYNLAQQELLGQRIEEQIRPYWEAHDNPELAADLPTVQALDPLTQERMTVRVPPLKSFFFVALPEQMFMGGISADDRNVQPLADLFNSAIRSQPAISGLASQSPLFRTALRGSGDAIELEISGPDLERVTAIAKLLQNKYASELGGPQMVRPDPNNYDLVGTEVHVTANRVVAADLGLTQADINTAVQIFGDGVIVGDFMFEGENIDLKVLADIHGEPYDVAALRDAPLAAAGRVVPLASVAVITRGLGPQEISRVEEQRAVSLSINVPQERALEDVIDKIASDIALFREQGVIPPTVRTNLSGSAAKLREVKAALLGQWTGPNTASLISLISSRLFLALLVTYLLMAALFESWFYPLVIMFSVPLAIVGGFLALRIVHTFVPTQQLDVLTMLGFIILIGIVVNNAILIVHQSLNLIRGEADIEPDTPGQSSHAPMPPHQAIAEATRTRLRPIMMTTATSIGGMLPLVLFPGAGSELYRGLGAVMLGGLVVSTLFTLILVPLLLSVLFDLRKSDRSLNSHSQK